MRKIWTRSVFGYNRKTRKYELIENESEFILVDDNAPIAEMKGGGGGSNAPVTTTTVQNAAPWGPLQPWLIRAFGEAGNAFLNDRSMPGFSPESELAQRLQRERALSGNPLNRSAAGLLDRTMAGDYLFGGKGFDEAVAAAGRSITPIVDSSFERAGRGGSGLAATAKTQAISDSFANLYNAERARQMTGAALAPTLANQDYYDIAKLSEVGSQKEGMTEAQRNERRQQIFNFLRAISGNYGGDTTSTSTTTGSAGAGSGGKSPWMSALGGGLMGGIQGGMYGGPWGALIGGGAGAGLGLLNAWS